MKILSHQHCQKRLIVAALIVLAALGVALATSDKPGDPSAASNSNAEKMATSKMQAIAVASPLVVGDIWGFYGGESFIKVTVKKPDQVVLSAGNPFLYIKEQECKLNLASTNFDCAVSDAKGSGVNVHLEYKEKGLFATLTKEQAKGWGPIPLKKNATPGNSANSNNAPISQERLFKDSVKHVNFREALRYPDRYRNVNVAFEGRVIQAQKDIIDNFLLVNVDPNDLFILWVDYKTKKGDPRILESDIITVWGTIKGMKTFTTVTGSETTVLRIEAKYWQTGN